MGAAECGLSVGKINTAASWIDPDADAPSDSAEHLIKGLLVFSEPGLCRSRLKQESFAA